MESITISADATDADDGEAGLDPIFEYKGPSGGWIPHTDSNSYFTDTPNYINDEWQITFKAPSDADKGMYSFQVKFKDEAEEESEYVTQTDVFELLNSQPEVEIESPSAGTQSSATVQFEADASDEEDANLDFLWEFGDGETSTEESPTHTYKDAGDFNVKVTVTDDDEDTAEHEIVITIKEGGGGEMDMMMLLLLLIPIIAAVLIVVLLLTRKKKKPEEAPPAVPGAAPGVMAAPAAPAQAAGPSPVTEVPAPGTIPPTPPPPVPAAAPAAAVAAAPPKAAAKPGQRIKCPKCGTPFTVESTERPITIECPNCHAKGKLT
jgi:PKD repeat protein